MMRGIDICAPPADNTPEVPLVRSIVRSPLYPESVHAHSATRAKSLCRLCHG